MLETNEMIAKNKRLNWFENVPIRSGNLICSNLLFVAQKDAVWIKQFESKLNQLYYDDCNVCLDSAEACQRTQFIANCLQSKNCQTSSAFHNESLLDTFHFLERFHANCCLVKSFELKQHSNVFRTSKIRRYGFAKQPPSNAQWVYWMHYSMN